MLRPYNSTRDEHRSKMKRRRLREDVPISAERLAKHSKGDGVNLKPRTSRIKSKAQRDKLQTKEEAIDRTVKAAARAEVLLTEEYGGLEAEPGERTSRLKQSQIAKMVDITSAAKRFTLKLDFGPYHMKYTKNGRHLVLGGRRGHVAALDWVTKKLACEMNVMESVHDVAWLHVETMFAVAQKNWVHIYDNQGTELHCLKQLNKITKLEFLPYHFLLASVCRQGFLSWLDVSIGKFINSYCAKEGNIQAMTQNPTNAVLCVGNSKGVVSMWSPNSKEPLAKMLCHKHAINSVAVHPYGTYMATSCPATIVKVWDVRQLAGPVHKYKTRSPVHHLSYSATGQLAMAMENVVEVYRPSSDKNGKKPYLRHRADSSVSSMQFCPFEDVLGVGTARGFSSLLVPGSGEANYDALEANPFQTKAQRREAEVKALLDKIQPEMITLDPVSILEVDVPSLKDKVEAKKKVLYLKPKDVDFNPRRTKAKGKGGTAKVIKTKNILKDLSRRDYIATMRQADVRPEVEQQRPQQKKDYGVLNRFVSKSK